MESLEEAIRATVWDVLDGVNTAFPAKIDQYDNTTQKATVKPLIKKKFINDDIEDVPPIVAVPVWFPRAGGASLTFPVLQGDTGLVVCAQRSLDKWLSEGTEAEPSDRRKFDMSDAVFFPGLIPFSAESYSENDEDILLKYGDYLVRIAKDGVITITNGTDTITMENGTFTIGNGSATIVLDGGQVNINGGNLTVD